MNLTTVSDFATDTRTLLQDTVQPYRYDDASLVQSLNNCFSEISRLRPDIILNSKYLFRMPRNQNIDILSPPLFAANDETIVPIPSQYKMAVVYFICGNVQLRDTEDTQDSRAAAYLTKFLAIMTQAQA